MNISILFWLFVFEKNTGKATSKKKWCIRKVQKIKKTNTSKSESRSTWKNSMCSALISLSICCYRYCYTEHRTSFSAIAIATVSQASKLRAEQSIFFLVVLLWLCYGSCQKESDSNSIAIFVFISLLRSSNCKYCIQLQRAKIV